MKKSQEILQKIRLVLADKNLRYDLHQPNFSGNESKYVQDCLETGWVSSVGNYVNQFELKLTEFTGVKHAVATVNGTSALHIALLVSGVKSGDEVLVPTLTFVATANAVSYCGAVPHFVDSDFSTFGVSASELNDYLNEISVIKQGVCYNRLTGRKISTLCVTHVFGHPVDLDALLNICERFHLTLVEDAAEALGSYYKNRHVGNLSTVAALSFNGNKIITTGGGGAILTNHENLAKQARHLTTTARLPHQWQFIHDQVAYNYRMPNLNAAVGCAQLERMEDYLLKKRALADQYKVLFSDKDGVSIFSEPVNARSNYWLNVLILNKPDHDFRDELLTELNKNNIISRPVWELMHRLPMYAECPRMNLSCAESLFSRVILLPSSPGLVK